MIEFRVSTRLRDSDGVVSDVSKAEAYKQSMDVSHRECRHGIAGTYSALLPDHLTILMAFSLRDTIAIRNSAARVHRRVYRGRSRLLWSLVSTQGNVDTAIWY